MFVTSKQDAKVEIHSRQLVQVTKYLKKESINSKKSCKKRGKKCKKEENTLSLVLLDTSSQFTPPLIENPLPNAYNCNRVGKLAIFNQSNYSLPTIKYAVNLWTSHCKRTTDKFGEINC